jgi:hypothetical protein
VLSPLEDEVEFSFDEVELSFLAQPKNKMGINIKYNIFIVVSIFQRLLVNICQTEILLNKSEYYKVKSRRVKR